ncbi:MAG: mycothione reductase [Propionibacteriaceae bacterium]|jgi:mycothione reductase|nr:mycothione reductase [Propionibacteriaceae bacterium]
MADFDIVVIGAGSGNALVGAGFPERRVALIDDGVPFGGTCLNKGCIPSKMLSQVAHHVATIRRADRLGVSTGAPTVDWPAVRERVFGRTDPLAEAAEASRAASEKVTLFRGRAQFTDPHTVRVDLFDGSTATVTSDSFVVATGSRPVVPDIAGLDDPRLAGMVFTSDDIMRVEKLPKTLAIMGGGVVATEMADIFAGLGCQVTVVQRSGQLLRRADRAVAAALTAELAQRVTLRLNQTLSEVEPSGRGVTLYAHDVNGIEYTYSAEALLLAVGRRPNTDRLGVEAAGLELTADGRLVVDANQRTSVPHIWALGDVDSPEPLKHVANLEARIVRHNLEQPKQLVATDDRPIPAALFTTPQAAWVGATEQALEQSGRPYVAAVQHYRDVAYGWAMEDDCDHHFVKLLADPATGAILGGHIVGPEAALLLQPIIQAMTFNLDATTMARGQYWPHPGLQEVVENALLKLDIPTPKAKPSLLPWRR